MSNKTRVGIDLGTTYSAIATTLAGEIEMIPNTNTGEETTASIVGLEEDESAVTVGEAARDMGQTEKHENVELIKRHMGEREYEVEVGNDTYTPEQISSLILKRLLDDAEQKLGQEVTNAVITVPAYFGEAEREATKAAGEMAGVEVDRIINEPTAACLAYGLHEDNSTDSETALVYDLGGGTFDVTLVNLAYDIDTIEVIASNGNEQLGGRDWDECIAEWVFNTFEENTGIDIRDNEQQVQRVYDEAKTAKEKLSNREEVTIRIPYLAPEEGENFEETLTREEFESLSKDLLDKTFDACDELLESVEETKDDIDSILLVGGSTRMPAVKHEVEKYFGQEPQQRIHPDKAVAKGAAIQANIISQTDEDIDDDEQAENVLPGVEDNLVLVDVAAKSLGVELVGGEFDAIIEKDENIPAIERKEGYTTNKDNQTAVNVRVYQGEGETVAENELLDEFRLENIEPAPAGEPNLGVEFELDTDGILNVEAINLDKDDSEELEISGVFGLDEEEIESMKNDLPEIQ